MAKTDRAKRLIKRYGDLAGNRGAWINHWDDLARVELVRRSEFLGRDMAGEKRTENIYDGTPMQAARGLANAVGGFMRPDGEDWFFMRAVEDQVDTTDEAKDWLADSADRQRDAQSDPRAMFRQATGEIDLDLVVFGTGIMYIGESENLGALTHQSLHLKDAVAMYDSDGRPNGVMRRRIFTVRQAEQEFGLNNLSEETRKRIKDEKLDDKLNVLHVVIPRQEGKSGAMLARNLPFTDLWIEISEQFEIRDGGFHEFPFIVPRWDTSSGEDYGRSPGMIALPDANTLQAIGETMLIAGQRAADPALLVPNDGAHDALNTYPGGLAYYDSEIAKSMGRIPIVPLDTGANMPLTREMQEDMREQVRAAFFRNIFNLPVAGPQMTATEVMQRKEEFIREMGPTFGRFETDYNGPMIERQFNIMLRAGAFLPIPEVLQGASIRFEYQSPVTKIKAQIEAAAARLWVEEMAALEGVKPGAMDVVNLEEYGRFSAEAANLPERIVNNQEEIAALREQRAQAEQQAQELAAAQQIADTANTAAGVVKQLGDVG